MLEDHLAAPVTRSRLRAGPAADYVDAFADWLHHRDYKPTTIEPALRALAGWTDWMRGAGFSGRDLLAGYQACKAALDRERRRRRRYRAASKYSLVVARLFIRFLQERDVIPRPAAPLSPIVRWPVLGEFHFWMREHRGLAESSLDTYECVLVDMIAALGDEPRAYTAETVRAFVLERARPHGIQRAKSIVVAVRAFLRFLGASGRRPTGLEYAIPGFASWQLASVPRYIEPDEVERVVDACDRGDSLGMRDRAVVLLLARLALRASEVAQLRYSDIDWRSGRIAVCGKSHRREWLPLPQEVGDAILLYLRRGRPPLKAPAVFTTVVAPFRPLTRAGVTHIVRSALRRAGIKAPINGAHVLRHSAATAMLRQGASLAGVGAVLRHRSPRTTAHYAKVDFGLLSEIARPWPGTSPC